MSRNISEKARFHPTAKGARRKPPRSVGFPARRIVNLVTAPTTKVVGFFESWTCLTAGYSTDYSPSLGSLTKVLVLRIRLKSEARRKKN